MVTLASSALMAVPSKKRKKRPSQRRGEERRGEEKRGEVR